ncbi:DUF1307 domain-containing protein [Amedibacillus sp. YH-ame10]
MKKIVAVLMMAAVLIGCAGGKETTLKDNGSVDGKETTIIGKGNAKGLDYELEIVSNGDKVLRIKKVITLDLKLLGLTEDQAKESMQRVSDEDSEMEGKSTKIETTEEKASLTTEIDYRNVANEELRGTGLVDSKDDGKYISLKKVKTYYEGLFNVTFIEE